MDVNLKFSTKIFEMKELLSLALLMGMLLLNGVTVNAQTTSCIPKKDCKPECCPPSPVCCSKTVTKTTCTTAKDVSTCQTVVVREEEVKTNKEVSPARKSAQTVKTENVAEKQEA